MQIAFILIGENEELVNYYREISDLLTPRYRCHLYNKSSQVNLNILQADKEGCPFKIILGTEELKNGKVTLVRRDNVERKIAINLGEENETEKKCISVFEKYVEELSKIEDNPETKKELSKEKTEFQKNLCQKSVDFRDKHIFPVDSFFELEGKIKEGKKALFLIPFCNNLECEKSIKNRVVSYSIRCLLINNKTSQSECLFCLSPTLTYAYLGRSH